MKLHSLRLSQFRQFREPLQLTLDDGINLIVGPNESGKSTLAEAIRAAFFERHNTRSVESLRPWGDSAAAPEVELVFIWQGQTWTLKKRFLHQARCDLQYGNQHLSGAPAEDQLADLLGYSFPGRGSSKAEHQGIPGLLWVAQGDVQDIRPAVSYASEQLNAALTHQVGELASSSGDAIIHTVQQQRAQWLTASGRPTGEYKKVLDEQAAHRQQVEQLDIKIAEYRQQVDELDRLRRQQQEIDVARPWLVEQQHAQAAQAQLDAVRQLQLQQEHDRKHLAHRTESRDLYRAQIQAQQDESAQLARRAQDLEHTRGAVQASAARRATLEARQHAAQKAYDQAARQLQQVHQQARRQALQNEHDRLARAVEQQTEDAKTAQQWHDTLEEWRAQLQVLALDATALARLREVQTRLDALVIQQAAIATRLRYVLSDPATLTLAGERVSGEGERLLVQPTRIDLPGLGHLELTPGGSDIAELAREQQRLQTEQAQLLQQLGVASLAAAQDQAQQHQSLAAQVQALGGRLDLLAPRGVAALHAQREQDARQQQHLSDQIAAQPAALMDLPDQATAEQALSAAQAQLRQAEHAWQDANREHAAQQQALLSAQKEWDQLHQRLAAPERAQKQAELDAQLAGLNAEIQAIDDRLTAREHQIQAARPEILAQDIERHTRSARSMQQEAQARTQTIIRLETSLQALGAQGLEEQREQQQHTLDRLTRRQQELAQRTAALDLLLELLQAERQKRVQRLQAPLQHHVQHYLTLLFPHAELSVDEQLLPDELSRERPSGPERGAVDALSFGAREQLGLLCRLAYADLLHAAGRPTLIILDDALVHSDEARLAAMKRILFDAATRHQILLFSCHPQRWRDLGVSALDLQTLTTHP